MSEKLPDCFLGFLDYYERFNEDDKCAKQALHLRRKIFDANEKLEKGGATLSIYSPDGDEVVFKLP